MLTQCVHIRYPILVPNIILLLLVLQLKIPKTTKVINISCKLLVVLEYPAFHISLSWWCFLSCEPNSLIVKFSLLEAYIIAQAKLLQPIMLWSCSILVIVPYKKQHKALKKTMTILNMSWSGSSSFAFVNLVWVQVHLHALVKLMISHHYWSIQKRHKQSVGTRQNSTWNSKQNVFQYTLCLWRRNIF